jgi:hypothetical protein
MTILRSTGAVALAVVTLICSACGGSSTSNTTPTDGGAASGGGGASGGSGGVGASGASGGVGGVSGSGGAAVLHDKVDLLVMVDNSISMSDKQQLLVEAVPRLLNRFASPPSGKPVTDLHIGLITSSLGGHGGDQCTAANPNFNSMQNDAGHLLPSVRNGFSSYQDQGFLWWDPTGQNGGTTDMTALVQDFTLEVTAAGESGCGYESQLEAWYRFLVDPLPPKDVVVQNQVATVQGVDDVVLTQRQDFLRPDSLVVVIMLSDEDDCSIIDGGIGWLAAQTSNPDNSAFHLPRATASCNADPNDACCQSCASAANPGCPPVEQNGCDPANSTWDDLGDHPNLRCWEQKRRFGVDFLYPTRKYVEALTQPTICPQWDTTGCAAGARVPNPLFSGGVRGGSAVYLAGIVGVPWQDLASAATLNDPSALELMSASEITSQGRWDWLTPKCKEPVDASELPNPWSICKTWDLSDQPDDPYMIESSDPRSGTNPATQTPIAGLSSGPMQSPINGHEWNTSNGYGPSDLQYACIFQLETPHVNGGDCDDATTGNPPPNSPLCQTSTGGYTTTQYFGKGYPGVRYLEVLRDLGDQAIAASICAKDVSDGASTGYGFNAAMDAVAKTIEPHLGP